MKYKKLTGVILKKQNYREADQIVTVWTREAGKVRFLARGLRAPKSKLVYSLQDLSVASIQITGIHLPTLVSAYPVKQFPSLCEDIKKAALAFYAAEMMLKITADEHPNSQAFDLLAELLEQIDSADIMPDCSLVDSFALRLVQILGFGAPQHSESHSDVRNFVEDLIERQLKSEAFLTQSRI